MILKHVVPSGYDTITVEDNKCLQHGIDLYSFIKKPNGHQCFDAVHQLLGRKYINNLQSSSIQQN